MVTKATAMLVLASGIACSAPPADLAQNASPPDRGTEAPPAGPWGGMPDVFEIFSKEGKSLRFESVRAGSYGPKAVNVIVGEADGLEPRVASCTSVGPANFHRDAPLGHHFQPELADLKEALTRTREIVEEVSYWPRCPMTWEVQDKRGANYRYCARKKGEKEDPRPPDNCQR
jgi:hypothetical protein